MRHFNDTRDWFFTHRLGLFLHWGIYSVGGLHEQELWRCQTPRKIYDDYQKNFRTENFHPDDWLDLATSAGMSYLVFTAKHHDGFCMWNTKTTDYQVMNSAAHRDILAELAAACQRRNVPLVVYYSCVDWHHPAYPNLGRHHEITTAPALHNPDAYLDYVRAQIREICTQYGKISGIWWDMNVPQLQAPDINDMIRRLQPQAVINNRGFSDGDFSTPERDFNPLDPIQRAFLHPTEACDSIGLNSWGYRQDEDFHTPNALKRRMTHILARGGNYLLNVGPRPDGTLPPEAHAILTDLGRWFKPVAPGLTAQPLSCALHLPDLLLTSSGKVLNVIHSSPLDATTLSLAPLRTLPRSAILLNTGQPLNCTLQPMVYDNLDDSYLRLRNLPSAGLGAAPAVIRLEFDTYVQSLLAELPPANASHGSHTIHTDC